MYIYVFNYEVGGFMFLITVDHVNQKTFRKQ